MKRYEILVTALLLMLTYNQTELFGDEPNNTIQNTKYPYFICDKTYGNDFTTVTVECISNVKEWEDEQLQNGELKSIFKRELPICIDYSNSGFTNNDVIPDDNSPTNALDESYMDDCIAAVNAWNCICGFEYDGSNCKTTVEIKFIYKAEDWPWKLDREGGLRYIVAKMGYQYYWQNKPWGKNNSNSLQLPKMCADFNDPDYKDMTIYFNMTEQFLYNRDESGNLQRRYYFVTSENIEAAILLTAPDSTVTLFDFKDVLTHEIGHTLLLGHTDAGLCDGDSNSIMNVEARPARYPQNTISDYEQRMFANLYCPELTTEIEEIPAAEVSVFPNPTKNEISIEFEILDAESLVSVDICSVGGDVVANALATTAFTRGKQTLTASLNLPNGAYFAVIRIGSRMYMRQIVVSK
ncbi:MAG: zinc-dependent metalloprotease [Ignavibacteria bacterium]|jgi:hypothetical protein|nr:zinc-dependent metalloprotease [Ignavibacteria bacterium]